MTPEDLCKQRDLEREAEPYNQYYCGERFAPAGTNYLFLFDTKEEREGFKQGIKFADPGFHCALTETVEPSYHFDEPPERGDSGKYELGVFHRELD